MATNNPINNLIFSPNGGISITGSKFIKAFGFQLTATTTDLYTVPSGKRAIIYPSYGANANTSGPFSIGYTAKIKSGGNYYNISASGSSSQNALMTVPSSPIILEAGESCSVTTTSNTGMNYGYPVLEFDNTIPLKTAKLLTVINGNNTVYTCPANTKAFILDSNCGIGTVLGLAQLYYSNLSGGSITRQWYLVNSGGSPGTTNSTSLSASIGNAAIDVAGATSACLNAGDTIVINTSASTATQMPWVNIMEAPA
jgi:hypothetical protein